MPAVRKTTAASEDFLSMAENTLSGQTTTRFLRSFCEAKFGNISEFGELGQNNLGSRDAALDGNTNTKKYPVPAMHSLPFTASATA